MRVLPIASGKGGVGKSLMAVNLSIALSQSGKQVVLVDLDLGASNAHTILGIRAVKKGIGHFLASPRMAITDVMTPTGYENLKFIAGEGEIPGLANLKYGQKKRLMRNLLKLEETDYLILDLGAGSGQNTLDFFLSSDEGILIVTPTLTSTLNAYLFLKNCVFRILETSFPAKSDGRDYLKKLKKNSDNLQRLHLPTLFNELSNADPENFIRFQERFKLFNPKMIFNLLEDPKDGEKAGRIRVSCREYLGIELSHLGVIYRDHLQSIALNSRIPVIIYKPRSVIAQAIRRIAEKIEHSKAGQIHDLDESFFEESFETAGQEAEQDFASKSEEIKNLLNSGVLTPGDLIETIRTQQYELTSTKKENALLKSRLIKAVNQGYKF